VGIRATHVAIDDALRAKLPVSYRRWIYSGDYVEEPWFEYLAADGSIASTAGDMAAYARLILNRGVAPGGRVLSENAFGMLTKPALRLSVRLVREDRNTTDERLAFPAKVGSSRLVRRESPARRPSVMPLSARLSTAGQKVITIRAPRRNWGSASAPSTHAEHIREAADAFKPEAVATALRQRLVK
jgi:hypothetical protein